MMVADASPQDLLELDDLEAWADPGAHPVWKQVTSGEAPLEMVRDLVLCLLPVFTGRSRYLLAAKVSWIGLDDGKEVFAELHRAVTVADGDADAGWDAVARALGVSDEELESARDASHPEADDLVTVVREHSLRSAHEAVGVAWVLDRRLPVLLGQLADALARHYGVAEDALSHLRHRAARARESEVQARRLTERYLSDPWQVFEARRAAREVLWDMTALLRSDGSLRSAELMTSSANEPTGCGTLRDLAGAHRILNLEGHNDMSLGHLSLRDSQGRGLWLKRGNLGLEEVTEDDFILIDFDGEVLEGDGIRHLEWPIHAEILASRPDVNVVAHTHPFHATVLSSTSAEIGPYSNEGVWFKGGVPHFKLTSDLVNTPELGRELAGALGPSLAVLLKNHGATFVGASVKEATLAGVFLERAARVQLALASAGLAHEHSGPEEIAQKRLTIYPPRAVDNFWQYYNRKLDRTEGTPT